MRWARDDLESERGVGQRNTLATQANVEVVLSTHRNRKVGFVRVDRPTMRMEAARLYATESKANTTRI
jgi:hypothetical protein